MLGDDGTSNPCLVAIYDMYKELNQAERKCYPLMDLKSEDNNWRTCSLILAIAAILDPRFKFKFVKFAFNKIYGNHVGRSHSTLIRDALTDIFNEYESNMNPNQTSQFSDVISSTLSNTEDNTIESFQRSVNIEAELDTYLQKPIVPFTKDFDLLCWWSKQASSFPILRRMARDILAIPMSCTISGSSLSEKAVMDNPIFNGLDLDIIEAMICSGDWLEYRSGESVIGPASLAKPQPLVSISEASKGDDDVVEIKSNENRTILKRKLDEPVVTIGKEKEVEEYNLVSPFIMEESDLDKWRSLIMTEEYVGPNKIRSKSLAPLLLIPPSGGVELREPKHYYIDDEVVNKFFILLKERYERFPHKYLKHHSLDSSAATFLIERSRTGSEVLKWVKKEDLKGTSKLDSNEHSRMSNDSEKQLIKNWFSKVLLPSLGHDPKDWSFDVPKAIPSQNNSVDCVLFVMKYADCLTHGNHFSFSQDDMPYFRYRIFLDLYHGSIGSGKIQ